MKFLLFNLTVGAALVYLLGLGTLPETLRDHRAEPAAVVPPAVVAAPAPKIRQVAATRDLDPVPTPEPAPKAEPETTAKPKPAPSKRNTEVAPPPLPEAVEVAKLEPKPAPKPAPVSPAPAPAAPAAPEAEATAEPQPLPSAAERNKALRDLVLDMERMVADKLMR